jgi:hypothetical protein
MNPKEECWLGGRASTRRVWHAFQGVRLACNPREFVAINIVCTTTKEEVVQLCMLAVQQKEGTKIDAVSLHHVGTDFYAVLLSFSLLFRTTSFWHEFLCRC